LAESILVFSVGDRWGQGDTWISIAGDFEWIRVSTWRWKCCGAAPGVESDYGARGDVVADETVENRGGGGGVAAGSVSETKWNWSSLTSGSNGVDSYWGGGTCSVGEVVLVNVGSLAKDQDEDAEKEDAAYHGVVGRQTMWIGQC
jgi:hypothetical protein